MENARKGIGTSSLAAPVTRRLCSGETILGPIYVLVLPAVRKRGEEGSKKVATGNGNTVKTLRPDEECALRMPRVAIRRLAQLPS